MGIAMPTPNEFTRFDFQPNRNTSGGDFSPNADAPVGPAVPTGTYPNQSGYGYDPSNREFSSKLTGDPQELAKETSASMSAFSELQEYLNNSLDTAGCRVAHDRKKPWQPPAGAEGDKQ